MGYQYSIDIFSASNSFFWVLLFGFSINSLFFYLFCLFICIFFLNHKAKCLSMLVISYSLHKF